ncbi:DDE-domain-containing protein [Zopfia rhizophila CBS 207.26]|uniref:DDE-domain-containing protein n=1 Tax=Zopfia rhizophila CBS 207.26 TaxID=1314779 RepID=A0A6A6E561_9PEZI|nr:DDE-domain-containing protein [Zopfia rhizophila CBS 207.26]
MKDVGDSCKALIDVQDEKAWCIQSGDRDWVSVIEAIGMSGLSPPPFVIFSGKQIQHSWIDASIDPGTVIQVSPAGWTDREIALRWIRHFDQYTRSRTAGNYRLLILDGHNSHISIEFVQFCEEAKILPLCLPHSTHALQPLDLGIFSPLAKAYKEVRDSLFGTEQINNNQFLIFFQRARQKAITKHNIASAWRKAGLFPYNPSSVLQEYRPKISPFISLTNENGVRVDIQATQDQSEKINQLVAEMLQGVPRQFHSPIKHLKNIGLTALADRSALQILNNSLAEKQKKGRKNRTKKHFGDARALPVEQCLKEKEAREARERQELDAKERVVALRGKVRLAKLAWNELPMSFDVFTVDI